MEKTFPGNEWCSITTSEIMTYILSVHYVNTKKPTDNQIQDANDTNQPPSMMLSSYHMYNYNQIQDVDDTSQANQTAITIE